MQKDTREEIIAEVKRYLRENIEDFDERVSEAWDKIDRYRAPLYLIDSDLSNKIMDAAREWARKVVGIGNMERDGPQFEVEYSM